jgi:aspartate/methionine/tyrosine aminotransferase
MYPCYTQLISLPKSIPGVEVSYWELDLQNGGKADVQALRDLIRPSTKMIILNNPNNPLGTILPLTTQLEIVDIAREHGLTLLVDEIFRPLFHDTTTTTQIPPSFIDLPTPYNKIIVTSSMSKAWGLSGLRIGWLATRSASILSTIFNTGLYTIMALGSIDEAIAAEALSERCRPQILEKHLGIARRNIALIEEFVGKNGDVCGWVRPQAGGTGFIRFFEKGKEGEREPVDDVVFCMRLREVRGVLCAPGSHCFGVRDAGGDGEVDFRGYVRVHITVDPQVMERALVAIGEILGENLE